MWPTEPARAGWSFNKWQKTRILKDRRHRHPSNQRRHRNVHAWAEAPVAVAVPADVVAAAVADVVVLAVVVPGAVAEPADKAAVADRAAERAARVVSAAVEAVRARAAIGMADVVTVAASSSRM